jgi:two-component system, OmpR family, phosphate regulon response regulator PhoB
MPTILIADDSRFHQILLKRALEEKGFQLIVAEDGLHATMLAQRAQPDAIVLDLNMPGGSGVEVLKRLKRSAKTKSIPVVIVTANADPATKDMAISIGASEFLQKPVNLDELVLKISDLLNLPASAKQTAKSGVSLPLPSPAEQEPSSESLPKHLRSWREILHDFAEKDPKRI